MGTEPFSVSKTRGQNGNSDKTSQHLNLWKNIGELCKDVKSVGDLTHKRKYGFILNKLKSQYPIINRNPHKCHFISDNNYN